MHAATTYESNHHTYICSFSQHACHCHITGTKFLWLDCDDVRGVTGPRGGGEAAAFPQRQLALADTCRQGSCGLRQQQGGAAASAGRARQTHPSSGRATPIEVVVVVVVVVVVLVTPQAVVLGVIITPGWWWW
jgi:hypothetical protein